MNNSLSLPPPRAHLREKMCGMSDEPPKTEQLLALATAGDGAAWGSLLTAEQERLIRMVAFRLDPRLRGRIDAADVVQEAFVQASAHREDLHLSGHLTSPSAAALRGEARIRLAEALDRMDATDREVLMLRHFEQLTNAEAARVVGIEERAAGKRYLRALARLREILSELPGGLTGLRP